MGCSSKDLLLYAFMETRGVGGMAFTTVLGGGNRWSIGPEIATEKEDEEPFPMALLDSEPDVGAHNGAVPFLLLENSLVEKDISKLLEGGTDAYMVEVLCG